MSETRQEHITMCRKFNNEQHIAQLRHDVHFFCKMNGMVIKKVEAEFDDKVGYMSVQFDTYDELLAFFDGFVPHTNAVRMCLVKQKKKNVPYTHVSGRKVEFYLTLGNPNYETVH